MSRPRGFLRGLAKSLEQRRFEVALARVLLIDKEELERRMATAQRRRDAMRQRPGPKPKASVKVRKK